MRCFYLWWAEYDITGGLDVKCTTTANHVTAHTHLTHHQRPVLRAVSIRVVLAVAVTSHHAEGLVGSLTGCRPKGQPEETT